MLKQPYVHSELFLANRKAFAESAFIVANLILICTSAFVNIKHLEHENSPQKVFAISDFTWKYRNKGTLCVVKFVWEFGWEPRFYSLSSASFSSRSVTSTADLSESSCSLCTHAESKQDRAQEGTIVVHFPLQRLWWQLSHFSTRFRYFKGFFFPGKTNHVQESDGF